MTVPEIEALAKVLDMAQDTLGEFSRVEDATAIATIRVWFDREITSAIAEISPQPTA